MLLILRTKRKAGFGAFRAIDFALTRSPAACTKFVTIFGLKTLVRTDVGIRSRQMLQVRTESENWAPVDNFAVALGHCRCSCHRACCCLPAAASQHSVLTITRLSFLAHSQFGAFMGKPKVDRERGREGELQMRELEARAVSLLGHLFSQLPEGAEKERLW